MKKEAQMKAFASESEFDRAYEKFLADLPQASGLIRHKHARMESCFQAYLDAFQGGGRRVCGHPVCPAQRLPQQR